MNLLGSGSRSLFPVDKRMYGSIKAVRSLKSTLENFESTCDDMVGSNFDSNVQSSKFKTRQPRTEFILKSKVLDSADYILGGCMEHEVCHI